MFGLDKAKKCPKRTRGNYCFLVIDGGESKLMLLLLYKALFGNIDCGVKGYEE